MTTTATESDTLLQITPTQATVVDLLVSGHNDSEVAETLGIHRTTVNRWRTKHPGFIAMLNTRRQELFDASVERLRNLVPKRWKCWKSQWRKTTIWTWRWPFSSSQNCQPAKHTEGETNPASILNREMKVRIHKKRAEGTEHLEHWVKKSLTESTLSEEEYDELREEVLDDLRKETSSVIHLDSEAD